MGITFDPKIAALGIRDEDQKEIRVIVEYEPSEATEGLADALAQAVREVFNATPFMYASITVSLYEYRIDSHIMPRF